MTEFIAIATLINALAPTITGLIVNLRKQPDGSVTLTMQLDAAEAANEANRAHLDAFRLDHPEVFA